MNWAKGPGSILTKEPSSKDLTCERSRGAGAVPVTDEPAAAPVPHPVVEVQRADRQAAVRVAVDSGPEEDVTDVAPLILLPVFRDEVGVVGESIKQISVENGFARQLLAKVVALQRLAVHLPLGEMQDDLAAVHIQSVGPLLDNGPAVADVLLHFRSVERQLGGSSEIDDDGRFVEGDYPSGIFGHRLNLGEILENALDASKVPELTELSNVVRGKPFGLKSVHQLMRLAFRVRRRVFFLSGTCANAVGFGSAFALPQQRRTYKKSLYAVAKLAN